MTPPARARVRAERPGDLAAIRDVVVDAFGRPDEADLVDRLRAHGRIAVSLVAEEDGSVFGQVVFAVAHIGDVAVLALAPLSVAADARGRGIGSRLIREGLARAGRRTEPLAVVLGSSSYYQRFGFRPAREFGIRGPDPSWGDALQALGLPAYRPVEGELVYPPEFEETGTL